MLLVSCMTEKNISLRAKVHAANRLNASHLQQRAPVQLRILALAKHWSLQKLSHSFILDDNSWSDDVLDQWRIMIKPGQRRTLNYQLPAETRYIALSADYKLSQRRLGKIIHIADDGWSLKQGGRYVLMRIDLQSHRMDVDLLSQGRHWL